jgi:hypothetical protein
MSRFLEPDFSAGDESTVGGYAAVHGRPAALTGPDGFAYSVAVMTDAAGAGAGAYLLFLRWRRVGEEGVEGHLETDFLEHAESPEAAQAQLSAWPLERVQQLLNRLVEESAA